MYGTDHPKPHRERFVWILVTTVLLTCVVLLLLSPRVLAGDEDVEAQRLLGVFSEVFEYVRENYVDGEKVDPNFLIESALEGLFDALDDPHSAYLTSREMRSMQDTTKGKFGGVGLEILKVDEGVQVVAPIEDTPAYRAGIWAGDIITVVDGESVVELDIDEVVSRLRGDPGTAVEVTLQRGESHTYDVTIERAMIEVPTVKKAMIPGGVGYLRISSFTPLTPKKGEQAIEYFRANNYSALIVDLRNNPGGLLPVVIEIADFFVADGPIVSTKSRVPSENSIYYATDLKTIVDENVAIAVLVNKGSASASEILAGALQDTGRALVVGENTYGKGSVQQIRSFGSGGVRLTTSRYYTPSGTSIDKVGIQPDVTVEHEELTDEEKESLSALQDGQQIRRFVQEHSQPSESQITEFIRSLGDTGIVLNELYLRRLIRDEVNRSHTPPVYDLEYDTALKKALELISAQGR